MNVLSAWRIEDATATLPALFELAVVKPRSQRRAAVLEALRDEDLLAVQRGIHALWQGRPDRATGFASCLACQILALTRGDPENDHAIVVTDAMLTKALLKLLAGVRQEIRVRRRSEGLVVSGVRRRR